MEHLGGALERRGSVRERVGAPLGAVGINLGYNLLSDLKMSVSRPVFGHFKKDLLLYFIFYGCFDYFVFDS